MTFDQQIGRSEEEAPPGKVRIICHSCGARYHVPEAKVRGRRFRATCKKCKGIIVAQYDQGSFTVLPDSHSPRPRRKARPDAVRLQSADLSEDARSADGWYVVIDGKPDGPHAPVDIQLMYQTGQVTARTYAWRKGEPEWRRLRDIPELESAVAEAEQTQYYAGEERPAVRRETTSETVAGGPRGRIERPNFDTDRRDEPPHMEDGPPAEEYRGDVGGGGYGGYGQDYGDERDPYAGAGGAGHRGAYAQAPAAYDAGGYDAGGYDAGGYDAGGYDAAGYDAGAYDAAGHGAENYGAAGYDGQDFPVFGDGFEDTDEATRLHKVNEVPERRELTGQVRMPESWSREIPPEEWGGNPGKLAEWEQQDPYPARPERAPGGRQRAVAAKDPLEMAPSEADLWGSARRRAVLPPPPGGGRAPAPSPELPPVRGEPFEEDDEVLETLAPPSVPAVSPPANATRRLEDRQPMIEPAPRAPEGSDLLPSLAPPLPPAPIAAAPPQVLLPSKEPFWTVGRIVLATSIAFAVAISLTVFVVALVKKSDKSPEPEVAKAGSAAKPSAKITILSATPESDEPDEAPAPAAGTGSGQTAAGTGQPPTERVPLAKPDPAASKTPPAPGPEAAAKGKRTKKKARPRRRPRRRWRRRRRRRKKKSGDDLLLGGGRKKKSGDDLLLGGGRKKKSDDDLLLGGGGRKKRRGKVDHGDLLGGGRKKLPKALSKPQITRVMRRLNGRISACFDRFRQRGMLYVQMRVSGNGRGRGRVVGSFAGSATARCVAPAVRSVRFPRFSGPTISFNYPYRLGR